MKDKNKVSVIKIVMNYLFSLTIIAGIILMFFYPNYKNEKYEDLIGESTYFNTDETLNSKIYSSKLIYQLSENTGIAESDYVSAFDMLSESIINEQENINISWNFTDVGSRVITINKSIASLDLLVTPDKELSDDDIFNILKTIQSVQNENSIFNGLSVRLIILNPLSNQYDKFGEEIYDRYEFYNIDEMIFKNMDSSSLDEFIINTI